MVKDALKAYLQIASGLTDVTRERAMSAAQALVTQAGMLSRNSKDSSAQVRALADELAKTARDNRDLVLGMVRAETERAMGAVGAASAEELAALGRRVDTMQTRLDQLARDLEEGSVTGRTPAPRAARSSTSSGDGAPSPATVKKAATKKAAAPAAAAGTPAAAKEAAAPTAAAGTPAGTQLATKKSATRRSSRTPGSPADAVTPTPADASMA